MKEQTQTINSLREKIRALETELANERRSAGNMIRQNWHPCNY